MFRTKHISAQGSGTFPGAGSFATLAIVNVNTATAAAVLTIYEGQTAVAAKTVAVIDCSAVCCKVFLAELKDGFNWVLSGANADITITFG